MNNEELKRILLLANEFKEGDLAVGGTRDDRERAEARRVLGSLRLGEITGTELVEDEATETLARAVDGNLAGELARLTAAELKSILLTADGAVWLRQYRDGLSSEAIAAVVKLMTNDDLSTVARAIFNPLPGAGVTIGSPRHFGSRIQPNSPGDDEEEILFSILEGLACGCGDVIIGLNPASDDLDTIVRLEDLLRRVVERLELPTRYCVLSDIVKQTAARARTQVDVGFQSLAGTSAALRGMVGLDIDEVADLARGFSGLYFETGQGSEVTNQAAAGVDMVTLESRSYGVARYIRRHATSPSDRDEKWMIVNDVAGFIGPEVFRTGDQLLRACLEDTVMAKLHGITMGLDVCATFHMGIEPARLRRLTAEVVEQAAPAYLMAVAGNADPMLGYLTTSFREHPGLRRRVGRQITTAMQNRLTALGVMNDAGELGSGGTDTAELYSAYLKDGGDTRTLEALRDEGTRRLAVLQERGFDLGYGQSADAPEVTARLDAIYANARRALYATLNEGVMHAMAPHRLRVRTRAVDREDYLMHPPSGEHIRDEDAARVAALYPVRRPQVQIVISDGLNADAANENLRTLLPALRRELAGIGCHLGETEIIIDNARVRAGYHVGALLDAEAVVHLIGERPGTGLDMLSAYLTYGRDREGNSRWSSDLDHSNTTAVCGIHPKGKRPEAAAQEIARCVRRMLEERCSGVALGRSLDGARP
ncbi:MAG TPA: ethanolamine ammonia-lyase subunit EutB [Blastocatellia bacterium]|nr:ethanolamine ammonia-lyase subunit EutB [Blastocatellia bacterium]